MGEIAEMMLNGDMDEETGEWLGNGQGFPRSPSRDRRERSERRATAPHNHKSHPCPICGKRFASVASAVQHEGDKHGKSKETA